MWAQSGPVKDILTQRSVCMCAVALGGSAPPPHSRSLKYFTSAMWPALQPSPPRALSLFFFFSLSHPHHDYIWPHSPAVLFFSFPQAYFLPLLELHNPLGLPIGMRDKEVKIREKKSEICLFIYHKSQSFGLAQNLIPLSSSTLKWAEPQVQSSGRKEPELPPANYPAH